MSDKLRVFHNATVAAKAFKSTPPDDTLLDLYALYKQATVGDINIPRPMFYDLKGQAKWEAWNKRKTMTKEQAMDQYIGLVDAMVAAGW